MLRSKKLKVKEERKVEEELAEKENIARSTMKLAMDTLDKGLEAVKGTHRSARRLRESVDSLDLDRSSLHLVSAKK